MVGRFRLWSGYILLFYVTTHLLNHALGLISLRVIEAGRVWFSFIWQGLPGQIVLYGALLLHFVFAYWSIFRRRALRLSPWEWTQLILGGLIVPLGALHVVGTRVAFDYFGVQSGYPWVLGSLASGSWWGVARQFGLPMIVWLHACIGIHFAWRLRPWYRDWLPVLYALALLIPAAGIGGAAIALRDFAELAERPGFLENLFERVNAPNASTAFELYMISDTLIAIAGLMLLACLGARPIRDLWERRAGVVHLDYGNKRVVSQPTGLSILEMSRIAGIPHASVCGGRGRCSTCRVRIGGEHAMRLPPPSEDEQKVLARVGAPENVRLACQLRPPPGRYRLTQDTGRFSRKAATPSRASGVSQTSASSAIVASITAASIRGPSMRASRLPAATAPGAAAR